MLINKYIGILNNLERTIKLQKFDISILQTVDELYKLISNLAILTNYDLTEVNIIKANIYQHIAYFYSPLRK